VDPSLIGQLSAWPQKIPISLCPCDVLGVDFLRAPGRRSGSMAILPYLHNFADSSRVFFLRRSRSTKFTCHSNGSACALRGAGTNRITVPLRGHAVLHEGPELVFKLRPRPLHNPHPEVASALVTLRLPGSGTQSAPGDAEKFLNS